nr:hypothetical protein [uncultured Cohaesibacter sp.]
MIDEISVIKSACDIAGITAPEDLTSELYNGVTALYAYKMDTQAALALHPWSFAQSLVLLNRKRETPIAEYAYVHQIPTENLIIATDKITDLPSEPDHSFTDYVKYGSKIYSNTDTLYAVIRTEVRPHLWNPLFVSAVATGLAAKLVLSIAADTKTFQTLDRLAYGDAREERRGGMIRAAINADQFTKPNKRMRMGNNPLSAAFLS